jgi:XTP/dITP diphosphohydrolase
MILVVATANPGKAGEIRALLPGLSIETLADHPAIAMPPEDEPTFAGNAVLKARFVSEALKVPALADDSGLCVDALGGAPGVRSARYGPGSDEARVDKLLRAISSVPDGERTARFVCAMALAVPGRDPVLVEGVVEGMIARAPRGSNGFGYDPIFLVGGGPRTLAEYPMDEKNAVSHRGRALRAMLPHLAAQFGLSVAADSSPTTQR